MSRRSLVKGLAWSLPAVAVAAHAPAYAASRIPRLGSSGGTVYQWGDENSSSTNQWMTFGAQIFVEDLPPGVTVTKVTQQYIVQNRIGQQSTDGAFYLGNAASNWRKAGQCSAAGCSVNWDSYQNQTNKLVDGQDTRRGNGKPGTGWQNTVSNTFNMQPHTFPSGQVRPAWDVNLTWEPSATDKGYMDKGRWTPGPTGRFPVEWTGMNTVGVCTSATKEVLVEFVYTVTLSDGRVFSRRVEFANYPNWC